MNTTGSSLIAQTSGLIVDKCVLEVLLFSLVVNLSTSAVSICYGNGLGKL